jgi:hypothetical protein
MLIIRTSMSLSSSTTSLSFSSPECLFCQIADRPPMNGSPTVLFHATAADRLPTGKLETNGQRGGFQQQAMGKKRPTPKGSSWLTNRRCFSFVSFYHFSPFLVFFLFWFFLLLLLLFFFNLF